MIRAKRAARKTAPNAQRDRLMAITAGLYEEVRALNATLRSGREVRFPERPGSLTSGKRVDHTEYRYDGLWVTCANYGGSYAFGNDGRWAELLQIAGVQRDPRAVG